MRIRNFPPVASVLVLLISLFVASPQAQQTKPTPLPTPGKPKLPKLTSHVALITISGLRADHANEPDSFRLKIPNLQSLRANGSHAVGVESVYPSQRIPAHVSMVTGVLPADHGVTSDFPFDEQIGASATSTVLSARTIKADTVWEAANRAELTSAAIGFPMTADATIKFNLPEAERNSDASKAEAAIEMIAKHQPHLLAVNFTSFDAAQRRYGLLSKEAILALEAIDGLLGKIFLAIENAKLREQTTFLIVSDHGASKVEREFRPNVLLAKKSFLTTDGQGTVKSWRAVAQSFGGSAAIFLKNPQDQIAAQEVEKLFRELEEDSDNPLWRITVRRDAARLGADPHAVLFLDAAPLFQLSDRASGSTIGKAADRAAYGYLPSRAEMRGALFISGKVIKAGQKIEYARLIDVAPTIARLLGLEMKTARGRVLSEVIAQ
jgi:predicted AlkP superfamily pyrophosphatase or phosphodiesterase